MIFHEQISQVVWDVKYRYKRNGKTIDTTVEDTWQRVAKAIARSEKRAEQAYWQKEFYTLLEDFNFLPGGRILAGAGTKHKVTLFNCFVMDIAEDSLPGIFNALEEGALTLQQGGGVGYDFSILRPHGDLVKKTGLSASGPVSFMQIWDTMCGILLSTGARRGAMMGVLRCDHPDILQFVTAKKDPLLLRHFNVSVMISDTFIEAVRNDADWALVFPTDSQNDNDIIYKQWGNSEKPVACRVYGYIKARNLWDEIIRSAYDYAEPGVLFSDTINRTNTLFYREYIHATNPCGEIPLPPYGACNLGALNLVQFVNAPFSDKATMNWEKLLSATATAVRFLDNVIDQSRYPLKMQREQANGTRRIGLGITGLADTLVMLNMRYGTEASISFAKELMQKIAEVSWQASIELAKERGSFPFYDKAYLQGEFVQKQSKEIQQDIKRYGMRNSHHNTIAPAGTISLLANNISNGIEPIFQAQYDRHVRQEEGALTFKVKDYAYALYHRQGKKGLPPAWIDTDSLLPEAHLQMQGAMQPFIDNAISKTINIPKDFPFEKLADVYTQAYELGLKGCTIFRPNAITGSVMEGSQTNEEEVVDRCCQFEG